MYNDFASNIGVNGGGSVQEALDGKELLAPVRSLGGKGDGTTNETTAIASALVSAPERVVELTGISAKFKTLAGFYDYLDCRFSGEGVLVIDGKEQARNRSFITNEVADPDYYNVENYFSGDWSKQLETNFTFVGANVGTTPITAYRLLDRASQEVSYFVNTGGINTEVGNQSGGRTGVFRENVRLVQGGQGDCIGRFTKAMAYSTRSGATHYLACPAISLEAADIQGLANGNYLQAYEINFDDAGKAVSVGNVINYDRTNAGSTLHQTWKHDLVNSRGTQPIDVVYQAFGLIRRYIDVTSATLSDGSVLAMKAGQRIHLNAAENMDPIGINKGANVTATWYGYDGTVGAVLTSLEAGKKVGVKNDDGTFLADPSSWKTPTLQSGWVAFTIHGQSAPKYRRNLAGQVVLKGQASDGGENTAVFTLPIGFRPTERMHFCTFGTFGICQLTIDADGVVFILNPADSSGKKYCSLDGIVFDASGNVLP